MSLRKPNRITLLKSQVATFGKLETLLYYADQGKNASARLNAALADKNALSAAKESRELISSIEDIYSILAASDANPDESQPAK